MLVEDQQQKHTQKQKKHIPWVEKYRPSSLEEVIAHEEIVNTSNNLSILQSFQVRKFTEENKMPNLLLYGPPGTGKTSTIIALARQIYGKQYGQMVLELNASDDRGIQTVRETIKRFAESQSFSFTKEKKDQVKLVILDEADAMTSAAQFALRRVIEKFCRTTRFCFICNYVSKIIPALQSRCTRFKFKQIPFVSAKDRMMDICLKEGQAYLKYTIFNRLAVDDLGIDAIFKLCDGDMRRVVNMLQSLSMSAQGQAVDSKYVYQFTGMAHPDVIFDILITLNRLESIEAGYTTFKKKRNKGAIRKQWNNNAVIAEGTQSRIIEYRHVQFEQGKIDGYDLIYQIFLVERMSELEYRLSLNCSEQIQLLSLIGAFYEIGAKKS